MKKRVGRPKKITEETTVEEVNTLVAHLTRCRVSVSSGVLPDNWDAEKVPLVFNRQDISSIVGDKIQTEIMPPETRVKLPSVTRILSETMSPESRAALDAWKERMVNELGLEGFQKMQKGIDEFSFLSISFFLCCQNLTESDF